MKKIVIIGATSCIAECCARLWVTEPVFLILVGRNLSKLEGVARDLRVRSPQSVITTLTCNFIDPEDIARIVGQIWYVSPVDIVLIAHGSLPALAETQTNLVLAQETLQINGISPVLFSEAFAEKMSHADNGTIAVIGSVAGDRGRKSNYVYGSAKGLVARYIQGLQHRLSGTRVNVILVKVGPTDTPMTRNLKNINMKLADPAEVAWEIVSAVKRNRSCSIYVPAKWKLIMLILKHIPQFIFNKINI